MTGAFRIETDAGAGTATVTFCRPHEGNRFSTSDMLALGPAIRAAGSDPAIRLVVLRAEGDVFCGGRAHAPDAAMPASALELRERVTYPILDVYAHVRATPVPVLAVVQGDALGFGCALVGQCDLAIASRDALFALPEMDANLPPTLAISALLHKVPRKRLTHLVYTRESFTAAEALAFDVVTKLAAPDALAAEAETYIAQLTDRNRRALAAVKEYMQTAPYLDAHTAARLGANLLATVFSSPEEA